MRQILVVDDSKTFGSLLCKQLKKKLGLPSVWVRSYQECEDILSSSSPTDFIAAVLDLNLPDAPHGEVVNIVVSKGIPAVVFTGELSLELRNSMWAKHIVDYLYKERGYSVTYLIQSIRRLVRNIGLKVLVVDDSSTTREFVSGLLRAHGYLVLTAKDGDTALETLKKNPDIRLITMDYTMPGRNGALVTANMRNLCSREELAIIGMSAQNDPTTSIEFLKSGANDFITKPFQIEEFYCRISQNVDMLNLFQDMRKMTNCDFLTGLHNRKMLFEAGEKLFASQQCGQESLIVAMLDIDFFKKVNDTYGHDGGDAVLIHFSHMLKSYFGEHNIVARIGGEEFCVLLANCPPEEAREKLEAFRRRVEASTVEHAEHRIKVTVSIGAGTRPCASFGELLKSADVLLYQAKAGGRNQVIMV